MTARHVVVGTAGHIDHGKTSLVRALTGIDTDRLPEEKARGITIDLGFAFLEEPDGLTVEIVDVPGHERFVKNMLAGVGGIDLAMLVVAADEGVMPQTREHLAICSLLHIRAGLVALTKVDMVEGDWLELGDRRRESSSRGNLPRRCAGASRLREDRPGTRRSPGGPAGPGRRDSIARERISSPDCRSTGCSRFEGSAPWRPGPLRRERSPSMIVLRSFPAVRRPRSADCKYTGVRSSGRWLASALRSICKGWNAPPSTAATSSGWQDTLVAAELVDGTLELLESAPRPLKPRDRVRFHAGTSEVMARVLLLDRAQLAPGDTRVCPLPPGGARRGSAWRPLRRPILFANRHHRRRDVARHRSSALQAQDACPGGSPGPARRRQSGSCGGGARAPGGRAPASGRRTCRGVSGSGPRVCVGRSTSCWDRDGFWRRPRLVSTPGEPCALPSADDRGSRAVPSGQPPPIRHVARGVTGAGRGP